MTTAAPGVARIDAKDLIRERLDIADVIGEVVSLRPAGKAQLKGLCPFHSEKTPSFHVHVDRGFFYCFGCQAKGDVFDFVMQTQAMSFPEALKVLGDRAGVEVTPSAPKDHKRRDLLDVNQLAAEFFRRGLTVEAKGYLTGRGLSDESIAAFELGFAPDGWDGLLKHALTKGVHEADLITLGLVVENERGRRYDRFRNRIMFPIKDALGRVVGFSGRVLDDSLPKYLNSPESELFRKSELLYGLDRARAAIRETREVIVVEGYTDVIALHQVGMANAVAALGATLTSEQADALDRLDARTVYLAFDADEAGQKAILSGLDQAVGRRLMVKAVRVPHGKDPAEAVLSGHLEEFKQALGVGLSEVEFRFRRVLARHDVNSVEGKLAILDELQGVLRPRELYDPVASEMRRLVIDSLGIDAARLDDWLASRSQRRISKTEVRAMSKGQLELDQRKRVEAEVISLALLEPASLRSRFEAFLEVVPLEGGSAAEGASGALGDGDRQVSPLRHFVESCQRHDFDLEAVLDDVRQREEGSYVLQRLLESEADDDNRIDVGLQLDRALSRWRELALEGRKEDSRGRLLKRREEIARLLAELQAAGGQDLYRGEPGEDAEPVGHAGPGRLAEPVERAKLDDLYRELQEIQGVLAAREAERRSRVKASSTKGRKRGP